MNCSSVRKAGWRLLLGAALLAAAACSQPTTTLPPPRPSPRLTSFPAIQVTALPTGGNATTTTPHPRIPSATPLPSPTPVTYTIKKGDTLLAVAFLYGIKLEDLQAANPQVDPRILPVGTVLVIPIAAKDGTPAAIPTPTPLPLAIQAARCYDQSGGGTWCLAPVENPGSQPAANVTAWMSVTGADGEVITGTLAFPPLDILPAGKSLPLAVFFTASLPPASQIQVDLVSAMPVPGDSSRYLPAQVTVTRQEVAAGGLEASVEGIVSLEADVVISPTQGLTITMTPPPATPTSGGTPAAQSEASYTRSASARLAAVAYDQDGNIVGWRKWELPGALLPGGSLPFKVSVYSLGPAIERVEVLVEARP